MAPQPRPWRPMSRDQFRQLRRDQVVQERRGAWTVNAPYVKDGLAHVVLVSGAHVRHVPEHFCDDYMLLETGDPAS